jgi:hypothetical protein
MHVTSRITGRSVNHMVSSVGSKRFPKLRMRGDIPPLIHTSSYRDFVKNNGTVTFTFHSLKARWTGTVRWSG